MRTPIFSGSGVAIITPFSGGGVDLPALRDLTEFQILSGTDAIIVCGTTGEASTMSYRERMQAVEAVIRTADGRAPVIAGTGSNSTETAIALSRDAAAAGVDGVLVVTPYYNKATTAGLLRHYTAVADAAEKPMLLYSVPSRTGVKCTAEIYQVLSTHPNINGVKEASGDFALIQETLELCPADFYLFSGNDEDTSAMMLLGAKGVISVAANIVPSLMHALTSACLSGDFAEGGRLQLRLRRLCRSLFCEVNPIPVKTALAMMGRCREEFRLPLCPMAPESRANLARVLEAYGLLAETGTLPSEKQTELL